MTDDGDDDLWEADPSQSNDQSTSSHNDDLNLSSNPFAKQVEKHPSSDQLSNHSIAPVDQVTDQSTTNQSNAQSPDHSTANPPNDQSADQSAKRDTVITMTSDGLKRKRKTEDVEAAKQRKLNPPIASFDKQPFTHSNNQSNSSSKNFPFEEMNVSDKQEIQTVIFNHFVPNARYPPSNQLPGPQPRSMTRAELSLLHNGDYWVCEKSDGERALLFIHKKSQAVYSVDRKFDLSRMVSSFAPILLKLFAQNGDTLLDAELIKQHLSANQTISFYSIFDVVVFDGLRVADWNFGGEWDESNQSDGSGRMDVIMNKVRAPYKQLVDSCLQNPSDPSGETVRSMDQHFKMVVKEFVAKHHVDRIIDRVSVRPGQFFNEYQYSHGGRTNSNDGLIFTPDRDDYFNKKIPLLKWKWPDLNTIDFKVCRPFYEKGKGLVLHVRANCRTPDSHFQAGDVVFDYIPAEKLDREGMELIKEIQNARNPNGHSVESAIVECGYSKIDSQWHLKHIRWDKSQPNFQTTVIGTIKSICDDIGREDIKQACKKVRFNYRRKRT